MGNIRISIKKAQLEAAYRKQQQEISELKDFVARNKARVATRNMAMSRQKKLDKMDVIELAAEKPKHADIIQTPSPVIVSKPIESIKTITRGRRATSSSNIPKKLPKRTEVPSLMPSTAKKAT